MQEFMNSFKRSNLTIMGTEEGEEVQAKGIHNLFSKIITTNFPNIEKVVAIQVQEASRTTNRFGQDRNTPQYIIIKTTTTENRERILKAVREKKQTPYRSKPIKITADFSTETLKARRAWGKVFWALNENNFNPRILYPAKLSIKIDGAIKVFHDKKKLKQYMATNPPLQKLFKEFCTQKMRANKTMKGHAIPNHRRKKRQDIRE
jgi:hypothetical protein